ncbi:MAG TPA: hypothetical protein IAA60_02000 [Candidatus Ornithomonoglobus intestinigallinarum]|uniref:Uncharacterized protein n=1 Tax=Candidatus Ornithomonoglobus intestinigallinarum TaxID=2840894 RepID=A0A9D1H2U9_9FIRM|nr:hypothetical protein [Candidatus Ornithomonoglobus intestinigallinarum]
MNRCRRCGNGPNVSTEDIKKAVDAVERMKGFRLADADTLSRRLNACRECEKLGYGSTCMVCGCLVEVRARLANERCPFPKNNKWK